MFLCLTTLISKQLSSYVSLPPDSVFYFLTSPFPVYFHWFECWFRLSYPVTVVSYLDFSLFNSKFLSSKYCFPVNFHVESSNFHSSIKNKPLLMTMVNIQTIYTFKHGFQDPPTLYSKICFWNYVSLFFSYPLGYWPLTHTKVLYWFLSISLVILSFHLKILTLYSVNLRILYLFFNSNPISPSTCCLHDSFTKAINRRNWLPSHSIHCSASVLLEHCYPANKTILPIFPCVKLNLSPWNPSRLIGTTPENFLLRICALNSLSLFCLLGNGND